MAAEKTQQDISRREMSQSRAESKSNSWSERKNRMSLHPLCTKDRVFVRPQSDFMTHSRRMLLWLKRGISPVDVCI